VRILVLAAALLLAVAGAFWLADRGRAPPPMAGPPGVDGTAVGKDPPTPESAADGSEQFAPVPVADREPVATTPAPPSVDAAALIAAGVPADAAADVATAFADLRRVAADRIAAADDLLQRSRRFQLNLLSGIADDAFGFGARLLAHLFAKPFGIRAAGGDDRLRF